MSDPRAIHDPDSLLPRGVHLGRCLGPHGERILVAVNHNHCLLENGWAFIPQGDNPHAANEALWERLDREDPEEPPSRLSQAG